MQNQQKQIMKNYQKEIEALQTRKQQIISEMKNEQDTQMKMQIFTLQNAIEKLTRRMSINALQMSPPPVNRKNDIVAEVLNEIKQILPLAGYPRSQSPPLQSVSHLVPEAAP